MALAEAPLSEDAAKPEGHEDLKKRFNSVLAVNRHLHAVLAAKQHAVCEAKEANLLLQSQLECAKSSDCGRQALARTHGPPEVVRQTAAQRDFRQFSKETHTVEEQIIAQNAENLHLSERLQLSRKRVAELQGQLQTLSRREREFAKQISNFADALNRVSHLNRSRESSAEGAAAQQGPPGSCKTNDYRKLPGLPLDSALGRGLEPPPQVRKVVPLPQQIRAGAEPLEADVTEGPTLTEAPPAPAGGQTLPVGGTR
mmetsp:Transcript_54328/g.129459  ORF Transcript_54328/g.129459 Transcript_54328/m.129459 type:complete len:256 (-) Transcript_54328:14-781(-)